MRVKFLGTLSHVEFGPGFSPPIGVLLVVIAS